MNGPEHYAEAERLLKMAEQNHWTTDRENTIVAAQVHATLALAAAAATEYFGTAANPYGGPTR